eukprot:4245548-Prymnesium_polylepis.2
MSHVAKWFWRTIPSIKLAWHRRGRRDEQEEGGRHAQGGPRGRRRIAQLDRRLWRQPRGTSTKGALWTGEEGGTQC